MMKAAEFSPSSLTIWLAIVLSCGTLGCSPDESPEVPPEEVPGDNLDVLATRLKTDPQYMWQITTERKEMLPSVLAAQKRTPEDALWIQVISMFFAADQFDARDISPEERRERYETALEYLEEAANTIEAASPEAHPLLKERAMASLEAGKLEEAKQLAKEALERNTDSNDWDYGNVVHWTYTVLGRVALRQDDLEGAKAFLLESGRTSGSPQLDSFGPSFVLARELLERGEQETVLEYLDLVAWFWANTDEVEWADDLGMKNAQDHADQLEEWREEINRGRVPQSYKWR